MATSQIVPPKPQVVRELRRPKLRACLMLCGVLAVTAAVLLGLAYLAAPLYFAFLGGYWALIFLFFAGAAAMLFALHERPIEVEVVPVSEVTTPHGRMPVAGLLRPFASFLVDLFLAASVLSIITIGLGADGAIPGVWGLAAFVYAFLGHRMLVPSLGAWALGLRRYPYQVIEEYSGKGSLFVFERLPSKEYTRRAAICVSALVLLYLVAYVVFGMRGGSA